MRLRRDGWYRIPAYPIPLDWEFIPFGADLPESGETETVDAEPEPACVLEPEREEMREGKDELLTADQMARVLNVHVKTLRRWVLTGQVACLRIGHRIRFDREDVLRRLRPGRK